MAKMKIGDLAKELGVENKVLIAYLQEQGVTSAKVWNSSIEEDEAAIARAHFKGGAAGAEEKKASAKKPVVKKGSSAEDGTKETAKKPTVKKTAEGVTEKKAVASENKASSKSSQKGTEEAEKATPVKEKPAPPKKKKTIIFVSNPNNSGNATQGRTQGGARGGYRDRTQVTTPTHRLIKPLTAPSQPESYQTGVQKIPPKPQPKPTGANPPEEATLTPKAGVEIPPAPKKGEKKAAAQEKAAAAQTQGIKPADKNASPAPDKGQGKGGKPGKGRDEGKGKRFEDGKGGQGQGRKAEKERKGAKNLAGSYTGEEQMPRSKRVGRFIKPEVKPQEPEEQIKVITIPEKITIKELADKMKMQPSVIIKKLFLSGQIVTVNSELTFEEAENIAIEYEIICEKEVEVDVIEELLKEDEDKEESMVKRPPVVAVMGHVDHGKTSLLDAIRETNVTDREAGGITQRIGAYTVKVNGQKITFLDTPGHEAFTAMRMRGANSTDIAILVVAADDGVMPQTIEAINHAKAAGVEIVVAINKIDKAGANVDRVKQELTEHELIPVDWGGTTEFVTVSAKSGEGIDTLLETILLTADILELKANPNRAARGLVLEAELDKGRGPVANVLVQKGTLHVGDYISAGAAHGRVRAMVDDKGRRVKEALPSQPVEILGLSDVPDAGEVFVGHDSDKEAKQYADTYLQLHKKSLIDETKARMSLDDLYSQIEEGKLKELNIVIKADVQGSVEALKQSLLKLSNEEVVVKVIHGGVGAINESDVTLAATSNAVIIGFDVRPDATAKSLAESEGVEIKLYKVIYQAIEAVEYAMKGMLAPVYEEKILGHAEVRQIFKASAIGNIAGSYVLDGIIQKGCMVRIRRGDEQIFEGNLASLKRFKDDVKEVREGYECGLVFEGFDAIEESDVVEAYTMVEVPRE